MYVCVSSLCLCSSVIITGDTPADAGCGDSCDWLSAVWLQHRRHQCSSEGEYLVVWDYVCKERSDFVYHHHHHHLKLLRFKHDVIHINHEGEDLGSAVITWYWSRLLTNTAVLWKMVNKKFKQSFPKSTFKFPFAPKGLLLTMRLPFQMFEYFRTNK